LFHVRATVVGVLYHTFVDAIDADMARIVAALEFGMTELPHSHSVEEFTDDDERDPSA
jgi:hypothetical protein